MKKILIVDDEVQILKALSRMFLDTDYEIFTAENGMEALKLLEENETDMIISDMKMPILDGYKLLTIVKEKYPKTIRIILSGYAEEKLMFRALLHNLAKLYVFKPWNNDLLLKDIEKLFADEVVSNSTDLMKVIEDMDCRNIMPCNFEQMIQLIEEENMDALVKEIEKDPDISALLIQVGKTAVYGVMPDTVRQAAKYIGLHNLKSFLHWACVLSTTKKTDQIGEEPELLWKHAYLTNRIFLFLYETFLHKQPPEATMFAGLMHNIGLIILISSLDRKGEINKATLTPDDYNPELGEQMVYHQEIGAHFLDLWDLPFTIYETALYHHRPLDVRIVNNELVSIIHIAQYYAWVKLGATAVSPIDDGVFASINLSREDFENRLARYLK